MASRVLWIGVGLTLWGHPTFAQLPLSSGTPSVKTVDIITDFVPPKYPTLQLEYVNPDAPKGGQLTLSTMVNFDTLNPYVIRGNPVPGLGGAVFENLCATLDGDIYNQYALIAEKIQLPESKMWVQFVLNKKAAFSDGSPVRPEDIIFSFNTLLKKGSQVFRQYYATVVNVEKIDAQTVRFNFKTNTNRELSSIMGQLPVLSEKFWKDREFDKPIHEPIPSTGPYTIDKFEPGQTLILKRNPAYWGKDLKVNKGRWNFDRLRMDVYRDQSIAFEAFKSGAFDLYIDLDPGNWNKGYDFEAVQTGHVIQDTIPNQRPTNMQGYVFNTRRPFFKDQRVREAIAQAFDFEWVNENIFYKSRARTKSFFQGSPYAAVGVPSKEELALLLPYKAQLPADLFTKPFEPPHTDTPGGIRANLLKATKLLKEAGWTIKNEQLCSSDGTPFQFEIMISDGSEHLKRITGPFVRNLERLGIAARIRAVDSSQYESRTESYDFDMTIDALPLIISPGNEQRGMWGSAAADAKGSYNKAGVKNPLIDQLAEKIVNAKTYNDLVAQSRALDRILLWNYYYIPQHHLPAYSIAYWNKFGRPQKTAQYNFSYIDTWWAKPLKGKGAP